MSSDTTTISSARSDDSHCASSPSATTHINLSHQNLRTADLLALSQQCSLSPHAVQSLRLGFNELGDEGAALVATLLPRYPSLSCLDLGFCGITDKGIEALANSLQEHSGRVKLQVLYLSGNSLSADGCRALSSWLSLSSPSLNALSLTANNVGSEGARWLAEGLKTNRSLTSLQVNVNRIERDGARCVADALAEHEALTHLNMSDNNIGDDGLTALCQSMTRRLTLKDLELSFNRISASGITSMIDHLSGFTSLSRLLLDNNRLGDHGALTLALALPHMRQLNELNIAFNEINSQGLNAIVHHVQHSPTIKKLWLSGNTIENDVAKTIATMLLKNTVLQSLLMDHSAISSMGERFIGTGIASNKQSALRQVTGLGLAKVLVLLGSAPQIVELSNEAALRYLAQMWLHAKRESEMLSSGGNDAMMCGEEVEEDEEEDECAMCCGGESEDDCAMERLSEDWDEDAMSESESAFDEEEEEEDWESERESHASTDRDSVEAAPLNPPTQCRARANTLPTEHVTLTHSSLTQNALTQSTSARSLHSHSGKCRHAHTHDHPSAPHNAHTHSRPHSRSHSRSHSRCPSSGEFRNSRGGGCGGEDSPQQQRRLRTYIVNPEVVEVAQKIRTIPFNAAELWELQQFYYSAPPTTPSWRNLSSVFAAPHTARRHTRDAYVERERHAEVGRKKCGTAATTTSTMYVSSASSTEGVGDEHERAHDMDLAGEMEFRDSEERPHKKCKTMPKIHLYARIKTIVEDLQRKGEEEKTLLLLRRLRYLEDSSGIYDAAIVESILLDDIMQDASAF